MTDQELQNKVLKIAEQDLLADEERLEQTNSDVVPFQPETVAQFKGSEQQGTAKERFLRPIKEPQTYMNLLYLLLSFPLGIAYFVLMVTGTALGFGLTPIFFIGLFILFGVLLAGYGVAMFEREMTSRLLGIDIAPAHMPKGRDMRERILNILKSGVTWRGVLYAFLKFPVGIGSFVITVTMLATSLMLTTAPLFYGDPGVGLSLGTWQIDTLGDALVAMVLGPIVGVASLHVLNGVAWLSGQLTKLMVGAWANSTVETAVSYEKSPA